MKEHPIIFGTWAIPKIQDGSKTQTRRVIKPQFSLPPVAGKPYLSDGFLSVIPDRINFRGWAWIADDNGRKIKCPYGQVGDRLWVRETLRWSKAGTPTRYSADDCPVFRDGETPWVWPFRTEVLPSIFMPRWASRITLEITEIRAERLQDISDGDAIAEGCIDKNPIGNLVLEPRYIFKQLWNSINGKKYPWANNDWVFVLGLKNVAGDQ